MYVIYVGGGVWRMKWKVDANRHSDVERTGIHSYLALACMQSGAKVYTFDRFGSRNDLSHESQSAITIHDRYSHTGGSMTQPDKLLCYGIDFFYFTTTEVSRSTGEEINTKAIRLASSSFYENSLHTWHLPML